MADGALLFEIPKPDSFEFPWEERKKPIPGIIPFIVINGSRSPQACLTGTLPLPQPRVGTTFTWPGRTRKEPRTPWSGMLSSQRQREPQENPYFLSCIQEAFMERSWHFLRSQPGSSLGGTKGTKLSRALNHQQDNETPFENSENTVCSWKEHLVKSLRDGRKGERMW